MNDMETYTQDPRLSTLSGPIFFDTNVVQNLCSFGEFIYDNALDSVTDSRMSDRGSRFRDDIFALADFIALGRRGGWPIMISPGILRELGAIRQPDKCFVMTIWANELARYSCQVSEPRDTVEESCCGEVDEFTVAQRYWLSDRLRFLPQGSDQQLIIDALEYRCDVFLTMDYKTIWRYRDDIDRFGLRVMRPVELLEYISPWAGLLQ